MIGLKNRKTVDMDIFNKKKVAELEAKNAELELKISELEETIETKGYKMPETRVLKFCNEDLSIVNNHYSSVIAAMNYFGIEIVSSHCYRNPNGFDIQYRLPSTIERAMFDCSSKYDPYKCSISYVPRIKVKYVGGTTEVY